MTPTPTAAERVSGTIKALEWEHVGTQPAEREYMTTCRTYKVTMWDDGSGNVLWFGQAGKPVRIEASTDEIGLAALQAAAQADYEARILAAIQPDPEPQPVIEDADMKRCAGCGSVRDRRGMDCLEDGTWRCVDCIKPQPVVDGLIAMNACLVQLDMLVAESGRGVDWGEEDAFRMGEWFEDTDLANIERAKAFVTDLFRATPSIAGTVSVEAAARVLMDSADDIWTADMSTATDKARAKAVKNGHKYRVIDREGWKAALRALAGEGGR